MEKFLLNVFIHHIKVTMVINISFTYTFIVFLYFVVHIAYENHTAAKSGELSINKGDNIGIIDENRDDGYWMVN